MNKKPIWLFFLLSVSGLTFLCAEQWPVAKQDLRSLSQYYDKIDDAIINTLYIDSTGAVLAIADAAVIISLSDPITLPGPDQPRNERDTMLVLESKDGFHIAYFGITPLRSVGTRVTEGEIVGVASSVWTMKIFDTETKLWVDPLLLFPDIEIPLSIKIHDFSFEHKQPDIERTSITERSIRAGRNDIYISLEMQEEQLPHYIIPDSVTVTLKDYSRTLVKRELLQSINFEELNRSNMLSFRIPDVNIQSGPHLAKILVISPVTASREFTFSLYAR